MISAAGLRYDRHKRSVITLTVLFDKERFASGAAKKAGKSVRHIKKARS